MRLHEIKQSSFKSKKIKLCNEFTDWACQVLGIQGQPKINFSDNLDDVEKSRTFGKTDSTGNIWVFVGNRNTADILRTLCHELIHFLQFERGTAHVDMDKKQTTKIEDEANAIAGRMLRDYGKKHVEIYEQRVGSIQHEVADSLPNAYVIDSTDPYEQYKFSVYIANARGKNERAHDHVTPFKENGHDLVNDWADKQVVISYDEEIDEVIDAAMKEAGVTGKKRIIGVTGSQESPTVDKISPIKPFSGY